jgi:Kef-type K+ transport system membrane component KefB
MDEHQSPVELLPMLAAILIGAKLAGRLSQRIGLPSVFGELVLGLVLGPSLLNLIHPNDPLALLAEVGVILLMFRAGLETDLVQMRQVGLAATIVCAWRRVAAVWRRGSRLDVCSGFRIFQRCSSARC